MKKFSPPHTKLPLLRNSRGVALVAVIWVTAVLAIIATSVATSSKTETDLSRNRVENARARALADAGVQRALLTLLAQHRSPANIEAGANPSGAFDFKKARLSGLQAMRRDGTPYLWNFDSGDVKLSARLESGKISLNTNNEELLGNLLRSRGLAETDVSRLVDSLLDFRDPDSERRTYGRETADYAALGLKHGAKNRNFEALDELLLVPGMTRQLYRELRPALTVYSAAEGFNPSYAPVEAFMALPGLERQTAEALVAQRQNMREEDFRQSLPESSLYSNNTAPVMTIISEATTRDGARFTREAIVALTPGEQRPFHIFSWD